MSEVSYDCRDGRCGAEDCGKCHPELQWVVTCCVCYNDVKLCYMSGSYCDACGGGICDDCCDSLSLTDGKALCHDCAHQQEQGG